MVVAAVDILLFSDWQVMVVVSLMQMERFYLLVAPLEMQQDQLMVVQVMIRLTYLHGLSLWEQVVGVVLELSWPQLLVMVVMVESLAAVAVAVAVVFLLCPTQELAVRELEVK